MILAVVFHNEDFLNEEAVNIYEVKSWNCFKLTTTVKDFKENQIIISNKDTILTLLIMTKNNYNILTILKEQKIQVSEKLLMLDNFFIDFIVFD